MVLWWNAECRRRGIFWEGPVSDDNIRDFISEKYKESADWLAEVSLEEFHFIIE